MPEPVCKSQKSGGYIMVFSLMAFNWVFRTKYSFVKSNCEVNPQAMTSHGQKW